MCLAAVARGDIERHDIAFEADPGYEALHKTVALGQRVDGVDDLAVEQTEITGAFRNLDISDLAENEIESAGKETVRFAISIAVAAHGINHLDAALPFFH